MERIAVWGAGECGGKVFQMLRRGGWGEVVSVADRNTDKQGRDFFGISVQAPKHLLDMAEKKEIDAVIFAFQNRFYKEAAALLCRCKNLKAYVVPRYVQLFDEEYEDAASSLVSIDLSKPRLKQFDVNLADHCNMKCRGCLRFSNVVETPGFADFDQMIRDWKRIKELFWGVERIKLMGGEPMLNPDLCKYIKAAREIFPDADIMVTTNALLINENCKELFQVMKENFCYFDISLYQPMEKRIDEVERILKKNGVWYEINHTKGEFYKVMSREPLYEKEAAYENCPAKNCHHLREGRLSVCSRPQYAHIVNEMYQTEIPEWDGVWDIYESGIDPWELDRKLSTGFEACRYCAPPVSFPWGRAAAGEARMEDWFVE